jgi:hypothetical protein
MPASVPEVHIWDSQVQFRFIDMRSSGLISKEVNILLIWGLLVENYAQRMSF